MARRTYPIRIPMVDRERRVLRVIKGGVQPTCRAVTVLTSRGEKLRLRRMPRVGRVVVISLVAADARCWQRLIVAVDMAVRTGSWRDGVRSG